MIRKLKIIAKDGSIDPLMLFIYINIVASVIGFIAFHSASLFLVTLATFCLLTFRDEFLRAKESPIDEVNRKILEVESELAAVKIAQGMGIYK